MFFVFTAKRFLYKHSLSQNQVFMPIINKFKTCAQGITMYRTYLRSRLKCPQKYDEKSSGIRLRFLKNEETWKTFIQLYVLF
jgi:hypothetical protein